MPAPAPRLLKLESDIQRQEKIQKEGRRRASQSGNSLQEPRGLAARPEKVATVRKQELESRLKGSLGILRSSLFYKTRKGSDTLEQWPDTPELNHIPRSA